MTSYYDAILALIPLTLVGATAVLLGIGLSLTTAVPIGASFAVLLIGHAMFVRSPTGTAGRADVESGSSVGNVVAD